MPNTIFPWLLLLCTAGCGSEFAGGSTDGATLYAKACSRCHGEQGIPGKAMAARTGVKSLVSEWVRDSVSDEELRTQILRGADSRTMPAFQGTLSEPQVDAVIAYVRELGVKAAPAAAPATP